DGIGHEAGESRAVIAFGRLGIGSENAVPRVTASSGESAHRIKQGAIQVHDLGMEAADYFRNRLEVVAHRGGEDEEAPIVDRQSELVLGIAGSFVVVALGGRDLMKAGSQAGSGARPEGGGSISCSGARGAVQSGGIIPGPIIGGIAEDVVESGWIGERCGLGIDRKSTRL